MSLKRFIRSEFQEGFRYELARGILVVTTVPGPDHGGIVDLITQLFCDYRSAHPGVIQYRAGGGECRVRLPGMQCDRHPDQAIYLKPRPWELSPWTAWVPDIVVEVISKGSRRRDLVEKKEEYLRAGVTEYWVLDPKARAMIVHSRMGDVWDTQTVAADAVYQTRLLPGLEVRPGQLVGEPPRA